MTAIGVTRSTTGSAAGDVSCRWWPRIGDATLCAAAPADPDGVRSVRRAYPLLVVALWVAILALFLQVLRLPRSAWARAVVTWAVAALTAGALVTMLGAGRALAVLAPLSVQFGGPGFFLALAAAALSLLSGWLVARSGGARAAAG
jgi:hypothetical protein